MAATLLASAGLVLGLSAEAQAAQGEFVYATNDGVSRTFVNPPNNTCMFFEFAAEAALNSTNTRARVYTGITCSGPSSDVQPGGSLSTGTNNLNSVEFIP
ncbi:hypothetical protein ACIBCO_31460 [Streptomyces violascens]|uniref:hypothetical protein n=1 Tax=Streptomyces violascens TaxID=67381 RepID=UPI00379875B2